MWVVDTCVLLDVLLPDKRFGRCSAQLLEDRFEEGLTVCPVTYIELAPSFGGSIELQEEFLREVGIDTHESWAWKDTLQAHRSWNLHIQTRRQGKEVKRPLADFLIGAFAVRFAGLITRNPSDFQQSFPELELLVPRLN